MRGLLLTSNGRKGRGGCGGEGPKVRKGRGGREKGKIWERRQKGFPPQSHGEWNQEHWDLRTKSTKLHDEFIGHASRPDWQRRNWVGWCWTHVVQSGRSHWSSRGAVPVSSVPFIVHVLWTLSFIRNSIHQQTGSRIVKKRLTIRCDTRCYFNVRSKADMNRLNLPHGDDN